MGDLTYAGGFLMAEGTESYVNITKVDDAKSLIGYNILNTVFGDNQRNLESLGKSNNPNRNSYKEKSHDNTPSLWVLET